MHNYLPEVLPVICSMNNYYAGNVTINFVITGPVKLRSAIKYWSRIAKISIEK